MVKCPRGTPSQIKANLAYIKKPCGLDSSFTSWIYDPVKGEMVSGGEKESEVLAPESEESDLCSNRADKKSPPTARDELIYIFISCFLDILLESWEGKPCAKAKLGGYHQSGPKESEEFGEDLGPCETSIISSMADYLKDLYRKRSNLSKEKLKKDSESTESEYLNEEDFESSIPSPELRKSFVSDEDVHFVFLNGVWYKGRVSKRLLEGEGYYFWEDGTTFRGEFEEGCVTGNGRLEFPDLSVYEGGVYKAFRHGEGMFCFADSPVMYSGQWWLGKKHGHGLIVYNDPSEGHNFYKGQWQDGVKEGFGFRQYPSGAKYVGFWSNGKRHGRGIMFWTNHDIYRGDWKDGLMHGYGEYTWNGFVNKSLSYPACNTYRGYWADGKRNGRGLFELKSGPLIETSWVENMKEGLGAVVCANGSIVASENLFMNDKPAFNLLQESDSKSSLRHKSARNSPRNETEEQESDIPKSKEKYKAISIPIHLPVYTLNLLPHSQKYIDQKKEKIKRSMQESQLKFQVAKMIPEVKRSEETEKLQEDTKYDLTDAQLSQLSECRNLEEKRLRNFIISKLSALKACYDYYAKLACEKSPSFSCVLLRLFLWQMLIDGDIPNSNLSLIDIDNILACEECLLIEKPHDPFERIQFWQFIQILIVLSWNLYGRFICGELPLVEDPRIMDFLRYFEHCESRNALKTAFEYFIEKDVFRGRFHEGLGQPSDQKNKFEESDLAPLEAMYLIYCDVGEPHSARDFVSAICRKESIGEEKPCSVRYFEKLPLHKVEGKNALIVAGELQHISEEQPFNFPEILELEKNRVTMKPKSELTRFGSLKARRVIRCLMEVCRGIASDDCIVNMDYQLTFLEFYKAIILCTKLQLKIKAMNDIRDEVIADYKIQLEEYKRQLSEFEKLREVPVVSRKKSRQFSDLSKKGRK